MPVWFQNFDWDTYWRSLVAPSCNQTPFPPEWQDDQTPSFQQTIVALPLDQASVDRPSYITMLDQALVASKLDQDQASSFERLNQAPAPPSLDPPPVTPTLELAPNSRDQLLEPSPIMPVLEQEPVIGLRDQELVPSPIDTALVAPLFDQTMLSQGNLEPTPQCDQALVAPAVTQIDQALVPSPEEHQGVLAQGQQALVTSAVTPVHKKPLVPSSTAPRTITRWPRLCCTTPRPARCVPASTKPYNARLHHCCKLQNL